MGVEFRNLFTSDQFIHHKLQKLIEHILLFCIVKILKMTKAEMAWADCDECSCRFGIVSQCGHRLIVDYRHQFAALQLKSIIFGLAIGVSNTWCIKADPNCSNLGVKCRSFKYRYRLIWNQCELLWIKETKWFLSKEYSCKCTMCHRMLFFAVWARFLGWGC